ncbi:hypothetical protein ABIB60_002793 [Hymenobacter sp. UYP22]
MRRARLQLLETGSLRNITATYYYLGQQQGVVIDGIYLRH